MTYKLDTDITFATGAEIIPNQKYEGGFNPNKNYLKSREIMAIALMSKCHQHCLIVVKKLRVHRLDIYGEEAVSLFCQSYSYCGLLYPKAIIHTVQTYIAITIK